MALASATALSWRPLPPRPPSSSASSAHAAAVKSPRNSAIPTSVRRVPGPPFSSAFSAHAAAVKSPPNSADFTSVRRVSPESYWNHSNCFCGNSLSNSVLWKFSSSPFLHNRLGFCILNLDRRSRRSGNGGVVTTRAGIRLDPGGGNDNEGGIVRGIVNLALAGGFTYLAVTGKLGWVFDTLVSLWLLAVLVPIISFVAFLWFAEREIVKGACPNCGQAFQVFEFAVKEQPNLCPYCSQPFKLDSEKQFVRDEPRFSNQKSNRFRDAFGGFGNDFSGKNEDPGGVIVDVEAEVVDRD